MREFRLDPTETSSTSAPRRVLPPVTDPRLSKAIAATAGLPFRLHADNRGNEVALGDALVVDAPGGTSQNRQIALLVLWTK